MVAALSRLGATDPPPATAAAVGGPADASLRQRPFVRRVCFSQLLCPAWSTGLPPAVSVAMVTGRGRWSREFLRRDNALISVRMKIVPKKNRPGLLYRDGGSTYTIHICKEELNEHVVVVQLRVSHPSDNKGASRGGLHAANRALMKDLFD